MTAPTLLASSFAAAAVVGSQFTVSTPDLVAPVSAQEANTMVLTAPTSYAEVVPVEPVQSLTLSLTNPDSDVRAAAMLDETIDNRTAVEVSLYGNVDPRTVQAKLQLGSCENPDGGSVQTLAAFNAHRSKTVLDTSLEVLVQQTEPVSLALIEMQTQRTLGCSNL